MPVIIAGLSSPFTLSYFLSERYWVAVGMRIAPHPPRGSGLEELPHPALASSGDGSAARRIRMTDSGRGEPAVDQSLHASPRYISELTAPS